MSTYRTDYHELDGVVIDTETIDITEEVNQSAIETNLAEDLDAMQAIVDSTNADLNANPAAAIKDIARMCKRLGRTAIKDYSEVD
jgi:hypothetical protein